MAVVIRYWVIAAHQRHSAASLLDSFHQLLPKMLWCDVLAPIHRVQQPITQEAQLVQLVDKLYHIPLVEANLNVGKHAECGNTN